VHDSPAYLKWKAANPEAKESSIEWFAAKFYGLLFAAAPETKALFKGDQRVQGRKLVSVRGSVVDFSLACKLAHVIPFVSVGNLLR
jgi:hemoglobin-like flavoprotein